MLESSGKRSPDRMLPRALHSPIVLGHRPVHLSLLDLKRDLGPDTDV
jgi:hypothetical protein